MTSTVQLPDTGSPGESMSWWGTLAMIATEAVLFALLLYAYLQLWINANRWPLGGITEPELVKSGFRSVVLLASSIPMHLADRAARHGDRSKLRWSLGLGWSMGGLFLLGHVDEWHTTLQEFTPATNAYGSLFYAITGLHMIHLIVGLAIAGFLWVGAIEGRYDSRAAIAVHNGVAYWHFVDAVWIAVFGLLYVGVRVA